MSGLTAFRSFVVLASVSPLDTWRLISEQVHKKDKHRNPWTGTSMDCYTSTRQLGCPSRRPNLLGTRWREQTAHPSGRAGPLVGTISPLRYSSDLPRLHRIRTSLRGSTVRLDGLALRHVETIAPPHARHPQLVRPYHHYADKRVPPVLARIPSPQRFSTSESLASFWPFAPERFLSKARCPLGKISRRTPHFRSKPLLPARSRPGKRELSVRRTAVEVAGSGGLGDRGVANPDRVVANNCKDPLPPWIPPRRTRCAKVPRMPREPQQDRSRYQPWRTCR